MKQNSRFKLQSFRKAFINTMSGIKASLHNRLSHNKIKDHPAMVENKLTGVKFQTGLLLFILLIFFLSSLIIKSSAQSRQDYQPQIADEIIRFHVIANSDSETDQALKLAVKAELVEKLAPLLNEADSKEEAEKIICDNIDYITTLARDSVRRHGYSYPVKVSLEECYFPLRVYGEYAFPPGNYEALRVQIGKAEGKNWWCVMFPPLCFVDETYSIIDESSGQKLKYLLTEEEYESLKSKKVPVKIRFKLFELLKDLFAGK